jgi:hypothetical protein
MVQLLAFAFIVSCIAGVSLSSVLIWCISIGVGCALLAAIMHMYESMPKPLFFRDIQQEEGDEF